jgi:hypothetical protein
MSTIVAGRFERSLDADAALEALRRDGFSQAEIDAFTLLPPGQHALGPMGGGDVHSDAGAQGAGTTAVIGAALGLLVGLVLGSIASLHLGAPALWIIGGVGALIGAFAGVMRKLHDPRQGEHSPEHPVEMPAGRMIAVCVDRAGSEPRAVSVLRSHGARDLGRAQGQWRDGAWRDFDPRSPLATV